MKVLQANRIAPDGTPRSAASHLGLCCLPMSHKREPGLNELKCNVHGVSYSLYVCLFVCLISRLFYYPVCIYVLRRVAR